MTRPEDVFGIGYGLVPWDPEAEPGEPGSPMSFEEMIEMEEESDDPFWDELDEEEEYND